MTKTNYLYAIGFLLLIVQPLFSVGNNSNQNSSDHIKKARNSLKQFQYETAFFHFDSALQAANESNDKKMEAYILRLKGRAYIISGKDDSALINLEKSIELSKKINNDTILAMAYLNTAYIIRDKGMPDSAMNLYKEALQLYESANDSIGLAKAHTMLAIHYKYSGDFDDGLESALIANYIFKKKNIPSSLARSYINLGNIYEKLGDYDTAVACFDQSYQLGQMINDQDISSTSLINRAVVLWHRGKDEMKEGDTAKAFATFRQTQDEFLNAIEFSKKINDRKTVALLYTNLSILYENSGMYEEAIESASKSIQISKELNLKTDQLHALNNLGNAYKGRLEYEKAEDAYQESLELAKQLKQKQAIKKAAINLMNLYELTGEYKKALEYAKLGAAYKDSIFNEVKQREIEKHKTDFEILHLMDQNQIKELDKKRMRAERNTSLGIGISLVIVLIGLLIFLRMRAKKNRIIQQQKIQKLEDEKKLMAARSVLVGQEKERERIARELHDGIGVLLSTASIHFSTVESKADKATGEMLKKANKLLKDAGKEVRQISHNMMPGVLSKFGLKEAIEDLFEDVVETGKLDVDLRLTCGDTRLAENMEIMLFRVIQEMLNNTLKHAKASNLSLAISRDAEVIYIDYKDDGIGFDEEKLPHGKNLGVSGIQSRIEYLGGKLELISKIGKGVHYAIAVPLSEKI